MALHERTHPGLDVPGCFGCKVANVQLAPLTPHVEQGRAVERQWNRDMPAYKRLRKEGLQPRSVDGAGIHEARAHSAHQIEGKPDPKAVERVLDAAS